MELCADIVLASLGVEMYLTLTLYLLMSLLRGLLGGKCLSIRLKNFAPMLVGCKLGVVKVAFLFLLPFFFFAGFYRRGLGHISVCSYNHF